MWLTLLTLKVQRHVHSPGLKPEDSMDASLITKSLWTGLASDTEVNWYGRVYVYATKLFYLPKWVSSHSLPLGSGMWILNYSLELCGGVFLGPGQQFSLCLDLAISSHLHAAEGTVHCMFCCASQERTRTKMIWLDLAMIQNCFSGSLLMLDTTVVKTPSQLLGPHPQQDSRRGKQE